MKARPLSLKALRAIIAACSAGLAGEEGEGDLADVRFKDLETARAWAWDEVERREAELSRRKLKKEKRA